MKITEDQVVGIMQAAYDMRQAQKQYFAHRTGYNLKVSIAKEQIFDNILVHFEKAGLIRKPSKKPIAPQSELFKS